MSMRGHNEIPVRLGMLADDAKRSLAQVDQGEAGAIDGWLAYGVALNEGRSLFPGDAEFGKWVADNALSQLATAEVDRNERAAAMWAAANLDQFEEARAAGKSRTVRGAHEKWKQIEAEREKARREEQRKAEAEAQRAEREARAKAAREEADAHAKAEAAAREQAASAASEEARQAAVAQAEASAAAKAEALDEAEAVETEPPADPPANETPNAVEAAIRAEWRSMTSIGREDSFVEARLLLAEKEDEIRKANDRANKLETWWKASVEGDNIGRALGLAKTQVETLSGRVNEHMATIKRLERRLKLTEAERDRLRTESENQMIPL